MMLPVKWEFVVAEKRETLDVYFDRTRDLHPNFTLSTLSLTRVMA